MGRVTWGCVFSFIWQCGRGGGLEGAPAGPGNRSSWDLRGTLCPAENGRQVGLPLPSGALRGGRMSFLFGTHGASTYLLGVKNHVAMGSSGSLFSWSFDGETCSEQIYDCD